MNTSSKETVNIRMRFADRRTAQPVLEGLRPNRTLEVSILRGRVTRTGACLDLGLRGSQERIERFILESAAQGASIRPSPA